VSGRGSEPDAGSDKPVLPKSKLEAWLDEIRQAAEDLHGQAESLRYGMDQFPPGFDKTAWRKAFDAPLPDRLRCDTALLAFVIGIGEFNTMIQNGAVIDGLMPESLRKMQVPTHYGALEKAGILKPAERRTLTMCNRARNGVAHHYASATADEVYEAISEFHKLLSSDLPNRLRDWLIGLGL
jgi:hypothetical protein